ncbi:serine/threonine-protein kinase, partial [Streptomyces sp. T-3]|nr:serine/threonine-protein kinase [Streptomyces sp. T-3]
APVPWVATAYLDAPDLDHVIAEHGPMAPDAVGRLGAGLAEALAAIHQHLVHRDLKPSNILITPDGPRVIDFGIAKSLAAELPLTTAGAVIGTPGFMSPEQASGDHIGPASDLFSLGAVLCFAATGHGPFHAGPAHALLYRVVHDDPDLAGLPPALRPAIARCLAKEPEHRPGSTELLALLAGSAHPDRETAAVEVPWWQQPTRTTPPAAVREPLPEGDNADAQWWTLGSSAPQADPDPGRRLGFPVGRAVVEARRQRAVRDEPVPGPHLEDVEVGDVVEHPKFGVGTVVEVDGVPGPQASATIAFGPKAKERTILLRYVPMRKIDLGT